MKKLRFFSIMIIIVMVSISCSKKEELKYYSLSVTTSTGFNCNISKTLRSGEQSGNLYLMGSVVELTVLPCSGYSFSHWSSPIPFLDNSLVNPQIIYMDQDIELSIVYIEN